MEVIQQLAEHFAKVDHRLTEAEINYLIENKFYDPDRGKSRYSFVINESKYQKGNFINAVIIPFWFVAVYPDRHAKQKALAGGKNIQSGYLWQDGTVRNSCKNQKWGCYSSFALAQRAINYYINQPNKDETKMIDSNDSLRTLMP